MAGITVFGVTGRMGQTLLRALREAQDAPAGAVTRASDQAGVDLRSAASGVAPPARHEFDAASRHEFDATSRHEFDAASRHEFDATSRDEFNAAQRRAPPGASPGVANPGDARGATVLREVPGHATPGVTAAALTLTGAVASARSSRLGLDAASEGAPTGVTVTADAAEALKVAAVAVDFSLPQCVAANAQACALAKVPLLVAATGFDAEVRAALEAAAAVIPILIAPNTSLGVNVMLRLVRLATRLLGPAEVEISEAHHRMKRDAPSGTALALGEAVARERGQTLAQMAVFERQGNLAPRAAGDIGFSVLRAGDIVGEHTVTFAVAGERMEITHRASDRMTFARGALRAAAWLCGRPSGLYTMDDVLGAEPPA